MTLGGWLGYFHLPHTVSILKYSGLLQVDREQWSSALALPQSCFILTLEFSGWS